MASLDRLRAAFVGSRLVEVRDRVVRRSLDELAAEARLRQPPPDALDGIAALIDAGTVRDIALIVTDRPATVGAVFARHYPRARVHVLDARAAPPPGPATVRRRVAVHHTPTIDAMHEVLSAVPPLAVIIDANPGEKLLKTAGLRHLLFHVADGGHYVVGGLESVRNRRLQAGRGLDVWQAISRIMQVKVDPEKVRREGLPLDELARADAIHSVTHDGRLIAVRKAGHHLLKLRDLPADRVLSARHGAGWGRTIDRRAAVEFHPAVRPEANAFEDTFHLDLSVPPLSVREYRDVVCAPRQLVVQDDVILPVSFHHHLRKRLLTESPLVHLTGSHFATVDEAIPSAPRLPGVFFHLDSEFPGHFGHLMTEDISKLWGWSAARAAHPDAKVLLSTDTPGGGPGPAHLALLEAWGIPAQDVVCIDRPVRVDLLIGATPMFYNGTYVHPEMKQVWSRLRETLRTPQSQRRPTPRKLFVTRSQDGYRPCRNTTRLEKLFADHDFAIVRPELLSIREQVDLFAEADVIAGFGGSGMFNAIYSTHPGRRIVITSDEYLARNEWAIAATNGDDYHHFFGEAEIHRRDGVVGLEAFHSGFTFDFERDGAALEALLGD